ASAPDMVLLPMECLSAGAMREGVSAISDVGGGGGQLLSKLSSQQSGSAMGQLDGVRLARPAMVVVDSQALSPVGLSMSCTTPQQQQQQHHHATCRVGGSKEAEWRASRGSKALLASHPLTLEYGADLPLDIT
ncbi:hypothetical protein Vretimale_9055, partial [Volvox reticuliferus]